jgi:pimeloyl-ACP methyl ester carboxylesterase
VTAAAPLGAEAVGDGPVLLAVHGGLAGGRLTFGGLAPSLADRYRVVVVDRPGFERTPGDEEGVTAQADRLLATIDDLDAGPCHALGFSFGGLVVLRAIQARPSAFASATLVEVPALDLCPSDLVEPQRLVGLLRRTWEAADDPDRERTGHPADDPLAAAFAEVDRSLWGALSALLHRGDPGVTPLRGDLAVWDVHLDRARLAEAVGGDRPIGVLTVSGSTSAAAFRSFGAATAAALSGRHHVINGAGHAAHLHPAFPAVLDAHTGGA